MADSFPSQDGIPTLEGRWGRVYPTQHARSNLYGHFQISGKDAECPNLNAPQTISSTPFSPPPLPPADGHIIGTTCHTSSMNTRGLGELYVLWGELFRLSGRGVPSPVKGH